MRTLICLVRQLRRYYPGLSLVDLLIAACEELLVQNKGKREIEVKRFGPAVRVSEHFITESYKDGLPEVEGILRMAREEEDELLSALMQDVVDNMKKWIEEHPEETSDG